MVFFLVTYAKMLACLDFGSFRERHGGLESLRLNHTVGSFHIHAKKITDGGFVEILRSLQESRALHTIRILSTDHTEEDDSVLRPFDRIFRLLGNEEDVSRRLILIRTKEIMFNNQTALRGIPFFFLG